MKPIFPHWQTQPTCQHCDLTYNLPFLRCPECHHIISTPPYKGPARKEIHLTQMWDLFPFLPQFSKYISLHEGNTPILRLNNLSELKGLNVKLEHRNPTGTFRDRACSLILSDMTQRQISQIINASTGSFSISLAAYAAHAQVKAIAVVPENIELSKIEQMELYGAKVIRKGVSLEEAMMYADELINIEQDYFPFPKENLLTIIGQKTIGLEIAWKNPNIDNIIIPEGSGTLILSIYQGFLDAYESSWISKMPRFFAVSLEKARDEHLAESLVMKTPLLHEEVKRIISETDGRIIEINAQNMIEDAMLLAKLEGIFIEPASASVISACKHFFSPQELTQGKTIAVLSGTGLNTMNVFASRLRGIKKAVWGISGTSTTRFEILNLIGEKRATYAPGIQISLSQQHSIQSIYQHLSNLEKEGLIVDEKPQERKKQYHLTKRGRQVLKTMREMLDLQ